LERGSLDRCIRQERVDLGDFFADAGAVVGDLEHPGRDRLDGVELAGIKFGLTAQLWREVEGADILMA